MTISIREATPADVATVVEFNRRLADETESKALDLETLQVGVAAVLADEQRGKYFLACEGEKVVGQLMITREWSDWRNGWFWWIQSVYVRQEARRRGIFRLLYEHVSSEAARRRDVIGLRLYVENDNNAAQATYRGLGMEQAPYKLFQRWPL